MLELVSANFLLPLKINLKKKQSIKVDKNLMIQYIRKTARQYQYFHNISFSFFGCLVAFYNRFLHFFKPRISHIRCKTS